MSKLPDELRSAAMASLAHAKSLLRSTELSDHEEDGWSVGFVHELADTLAEHRSRVESGLPPDPPNVGYWLSRTLELRISGQDEHEPLSHAVYEAGAAVDRFDGEMWHRPGWHLPGNR